MLNQQQGSQPDFMTGIIQWWSQIPLGIKFLFVSSTVLCVLDWPFGNFFTWFLMDAPYLTFYGQIWRIFLCQFVHYSVFNLLFSLVTIYFYAVEVENNIGTVAFLVDMLVKNALVQVIYLIFCLIFSFVFSPILYIASFGLWNVAMVYLSLRCFKHPDQESQFLCLPITINNKIYPIIIVLLVNLLSFPRIDILAAVLLAFIESQYFQGQLFKLSENRINAIANTFLFRNSLDRPDYVAFGGRQEHGSLQSSFQVDGARGNQQQNNVPVNFVEYEGKGTKIGQSMDVDVQTQMELNSYDNPSKIVQVQRSPKFLIQFNISAEVKIQVHDEQTDEQQQHKVQNKKYNYLGDEQA